MIQDILTYTVVAWAFYQVVMFFYRSLKHGRSMSCNGACCSCDAKKQLMKNIKSGKFPTLLEDIKS